jgi:hypothetical protein
MPRVTWPLLRNRPCIQVVLVPWFGGRNFVRDLLADTGAGSSRSGFDLLLNEQDCIACGGNPATSLQVHGAYAGTFPVYLIQVQIPQLGFNGNVRAIGAPSVPLGFGGITAFHFLRRFTYGNFAMPNEFGLEI